MNRSLLFASSVVVIAFILLFIFNFLLSADNNSMSTLQIGEQTINILIADTNAEREKGLGGRDSLAAGQGMFFIFDHDDTYGFWMKNMRFSIDMIWISSENKIIYIVENVAPTTYPRVFSPNQPARYVLELPAGSVKAFQIKLGDIVRR